LTAAEKFGIIVERKRKKMKLNEKQIEILTNALYQYSSIIPGLLDNEYVSEDRKVEMREYMDMIPELKQSMVEIANELAMERLIKEYRKVGA
jgi:hypothetical protein